MYIILLHPVLWICMTLSHMLSRYFLVGLVCGSFQFIPQSSVLLPSFFVVDILPLHSSILLITSYVIHGLYKYVYKIVINTFTVLHELYCKECKWYANRLANNDTDYKVHDSCRGAWGSKSRWYKVKSPSPPHTWQLKKPQTQPCRYKCVLTSLCQQHETCKTSF